MKTIRSLPLAARSSPVAPLSGQANNSVPANPAPPTNALEIILDGQRTEATLEGIGALSAGASSRRVIDYPEPQRRESAAVAGPNSTHRPSP